MKIAINAATANLTAEAGIVTWDRNIIRHLLAVDGVNSYILYTNGKPRQPFLKPSARVKVNNLHRFRWICRPLSLLTGGRLRSTLEQMLSFELAVRRPALYFQTGHAAQPHYYNVPTVVTLFDVAYLMPQYMQFFDPAGLALLTKNSANSVRHADHILTISEHSKKDIATHYGYPEDKITVVYPGVDRAVFSPQPSEKIASIKEKYNLHTPYILHIGSLQPRKNLRVLMEACQQLKETGNLHHKLVLAGMRGWLEDAIYAAVSEFGLEDDVDFLGLVPGDDLPALLCGADMLALPSLYEGFGLTLVEAMSSGVPVLASNVSSIPEVVGDAAILLDPYDASVWAESIERLTNDRDLAATMIAKGFTQVEQFSWEKAARRTLDVLERVAQEHDSGKAQRRKRLLL